MSWTRIWALLHRATRRLWLRVGSFALLAVLAVFLSSLLSHLVPQRLAQALSPDALMPVLTILATSMLAVSTFSLNVMVSAHRAAAAQATPRVHRLLLEDTTTQNALGVFIGAFVYALTAIILFRTHLSGDGAAVIMTGVTVAVVVLVILSMLRWIDHLSRLGSLDNALDVTEAHSAEVLKQIAKAPNLGGVGLGKETVLPTDLTPLPAPGSGYVQMIDMAALAACLQGPGQQIYIERVPGHVVLKGRAMAQVSGTPSPAQMERIAACFLIGDMRSFEQDAEFGLTVLSEIASRALSPGVNDPGTAIEAISRMERLIWAWAHAQVDQAQPRFAQIFLPGVTAHDLVQAAFLPLTRDGAAQIEVASHLADALSALHLCGQDDLSQAAQDMQARLLAHAETALALPQDKEKLKRASRAG